MDQYREKIFLSLPTLKNNKLYGIAMSFLHHTRGICAGAIDILATYGIGFWKNIYENRRASQ